MKFQLFGEASLRAESSTPEPCPDARDAAKWMSCGTRPQVGSYKLPNTTPGSWVYSALFAFSLAWLATEPQQPSFRQEFELGPGPAYGGREIKNDLQNPG
jgi:hypothetical protein